MKTDLFYKNVTVLDYAYLDKDKGIIGNSISIHVTFFGSIGAEGVLYDFSYAKNKVKDIIDRDCDHRLVVPKNVYNKETKQLHFKFDNDKYSIEYNAPGCAICEVDAMEVTYQGIKSYLEQQIQKELPNNISSVRLDFEEENSNGDLFYSYSHGLKAHHGNCQRLFHGHRSKLMIFSGPKRLLDLEQKIINEVIRKPVHIANWDNVINKKELIGNIPEPEGHIQSDGNVHIRYQTAQGIFEAKIPANLVYFLKKESTVENLSTHLASVARQLAPQEKDLIIQAFEGIGKGAITSL